MYRYKGKQHLQTNIDNLRRLVSSISDGGTDSVRAMLQQSSTSLHVNEIESESGKTPLMLACELGNVEIVSLLLEAEADVNIEDADSWTSLVYALKESHENVAQLLINNEASLNKFDKNKWSPLTWASYLNLVSTVELMLNKGAAAEHKDAYGVSCLSWAAGRGNTDVCKVILEHNSGQFINASDKYGTTPLLWACRKGFFESAQVLLEAGADVDITGMSGWNPLIASAMVGNQRLVDLVLSHFPQLDACDKNGLTALMIAAKNGFAEIADALIDAKASVNKIDAHGDSALTHSVKNGHLDVVSLLINQGVDVDHIGGDNKFPLMNAIERDKTEIAVCLIKDGRANVNMLSENDDSCLLKATHKSNHIIVECLLDHNANVFACDSLGNTPIHIAVKGRMSKITESLLSNPKHGRILYMPNKAGETPYNMDARQNDGKVLNQVFGARRFLPDEDENHRLLGYHLYSASLADFFSEPMLNLPITLGLFAKWGSGKSHFLPRLESDMRSFCQTVPATHQTMKRWTIYFFLFAIGAIITSFGAFAPDSITVPGRITVVVSGVCIGVFPVFFIEFIRLLSSRSNCASSVVQRLDSCILYLYLLLCIVFKTPPSKLKGQREPRAIRYLFTDRSRVTSVGGEAAIAKLVASLCNAAEAEFGFLATRLFQASLSSNSTSSSRFKLSLCLPSFVFAILFIVCSVTLGFVLMLVDHTVWLTPIFVLSGILLLILLLHIHTIGKIVYYFHKSQFRKSMILADKCSTMPEGKFVQQLKRQVETLSKLVNGIDDFSQYSTRMVVFVDGLDSCEQEKVLRVLETVTILFCYPNMPFIVVYCLDPGIIIKSIEQHIQSQFRNENVKSYEYMRTIVHLPFYFPDLGKESHSLQVWNQLSADNVDVDVSPMTQGKSFRVSFNQIAGPSANRGVLTKAGAYASTRQSVLSTWNLNKMLSSERDCLTDLNPREMHRLINIISVSGRLMRADRIVFDWKKLALWIHMTEKWSYHISWLIFYVQKNIKKFTKSTTLKEVYDEFRSALPLEKEDKKFEQDAERRLLDIFINHQQPKINLEDVKSFYPYTINLDPSLKTFIDNYSEEITPKSFNYSPEFHGGLQMTKPQFVLSDARNMYSTFAHQSMFQYTPAIHRGEEHNREPKLNLSSLHNALNQDENSKPLTAYTLEEICSQISAIEGIDKNKLADYQTILRVQNINGKVLAVCDMEELKCYLNMTFGDWNIFKQWVYSKRMLDADEIETTVTSRSLNDDDHHVHDTAITTIPEHSSNSPPDLEQRDDLTDLPVNPRDTEGRGNTDSTPGTNSASCSHKNSIVGTPGDLNSAGSVSQIFEKDFLRDTSSAYVKTPSDGSPVKTTYFRQAQSSNASEQVLDEVVSVAKRNVSRTKSSDGEQFRRSVSSDSRIKRKRNSVVIYRPDHLDLSVEDSSIRKFVSNDSLFTRVKNRRFFHVDSLWKSKSREKNTDETEPLSQSVEPLDPANCTDSTFYSFLTTDV